MDNNDNKTFQEADQAENKKIIYLEDYIRIPDDYDEDAYVNLNNPIDWNKIK